jgi:hypothetical protein
MAFEYARLLDDFNRPNADPVDGGYVLPTGTGNGVNKVLTNQLAPSGTGGRKDSVYVAGGYMVDCGCYIEVAVEEDWQVAGCRWQIPTNTGRNGYYFQHKTDGSYTLRTYVNDADGQTFATGGGGASPTLSPGDAIGCEVLGNVVKGWLRVSGVWVLVAAVADLQNTFAGGYLAIEQASTSGNGRIENFWGGALPRPGFTSAIRRSRSGVWT